MCTILFTAKLLFVLYMPSKNVKKQHRNSSSSYGSRVNKQISETVNAFEHLFGGFKTLKTPCLQNFVRLDYRAAKGGRATGTPMTQQKYSYQ